MRSNHYRLFSARAVLLCCAAAMTLIPNHRSDGFSYYLIGSQKVTWDGGTSIRYLSPGSFPPDSAAEAAVVEAMALWNIVPATSFQYQVTRLDEDVSIDHFDGFSDTAAVSADQLDPGVIGVTYLVNDGPSWFDMDVVFSDFPSGAGYTFELNPPCDVVGAPTPSNGFALILVAAHEFGHALGLGHDPIGNEPSSTSWFPATMNPRYPGGGPIGNHNIVELHADDRGGLRSLYPHSGPSLPHAVDLAVGSYAPTSVVGKTRPLSIVPSAAYPGDEIIAQSVIQNLGTSNEFFVRQGFYLSNDETVDSRDLFLGALTWDLAFGDQFVYEVGFNLPDDMPAGTYYLGSMLDDQNDVVEQYEDNNAVTYCEPLVVLQRQPVMEPVPQALAPCGVAFSSPAPPITLPLNMVPITWSLIGPPPGMTIHPTTGVISWPEPVPSPFLYAVTVRATNGAGSSNQSFFVGVPQSVPSLIAVANEQTACRSTYLGPRMRLTSSSCMEPILSWSLVSGPPGMTVNPNNGSVIWPAAVASATPFPITVRAANATGVAWVSWLLTVAPGDLNGDETITRGDLLLMGSCLSGPGGSTSGVCACANFDGDGDMDLRDLASALVGIE